MRRHDSEVVQRPLAYDTQAAFERAMLCSAIAMQRHWDGQSDRLGTVARWQDPGHRHYPALPDCVRSESDPPARGRVIAGDSGAQTQVTGIQGTGAGER